MLLMLPFDDLYVCIYERTNTTELKKVLINLIFELDDKAIDKLLLNVQKKKTFKEEKKNNKERKSNVLCLIILYVFLIYSL